MEQIDFVQTLVGWGIFWQVQHILVNYVKFSLTPQT